MHSANSERPSKGALHPIQESAQTAQAVSEIQLNKDLNQKITLGLYRDDVFFFFFFFFFTLSFIFTSFREQDEAYINSLRWLALVELEPAYTRM